MGSVKEIGELIVSSVKRYVSDAISDMDSKILELETLLKDVPVVPGPQGERGLQGERGEPGIVDPEQIQKSVDEVFELFIEGLNAESLTEPRKEHCNVSQ